MPQARRRPLSKVQRKVHTGPAPSRSSRLLRRFAWTTAILLFATYFAVAACLLLLRYFNPPTTAVQIERSVSARLHGNPYHKRYIFVPTDRISPNLTHAVVAAEDTRFYSHYGFDWSEIQSSLGQDLRGGKPRGASTITQQLVRNLFLSTGRSVIRKAIEATIVPFAEIILGKDRILELYLNVVEWGPGVYGAQAVSEYYFHTPASSVDRQQSAELAALLPAPLHRHPGQPAWYVKRVLERMRAMGH